MKIAIISDIHGNTWALEAVLKDIKSKKIKEIYDLGDSLYGPLDPMGTFKLIEKNHIKSLSGNEDRIIIENLEKKSGNPTIDYVVGSLDAKAINWLNQLPKERVINGSFYCCHGTPQSDTTYLLEEVQPNIVTVRLANNIESLLGGIKQKYILCGHSHKPNIVETNQRTIINPGSVGIPAYDDDLPHFHKMENHSTKARYCTIEIVGNSVTIEHIALSYNFEEAAKLAEINERPDWALWIRTGRA